MKAPEFFTRLSRLMRTNPSTPADAPVVARIANVGIVPGQPFDFARLEISRQRALERTVSEVQSVMAKNANSGRKPVNGWVIGYKMGAYGTDYMTRAAVARSALGSNLPEDAIYASHCRGMRRINGGLD